MIDINGWGRFDCGKLFKCENTGNILAKDVVDGSGDTPYVTASGYNNGVVAHIDASNHEIIKGHCILVGGKTFTITYQEDDFVSNDSHNFTVRVRNYDVSDNVYLYLATIVYRYFCQKYSWGDAVTKDKLMAEKIPLPATSDGQPNWDYMESYMKAVMEESEKSLENLKKADDAKHLIDVSEWKRFHLYDDGMFGIDMGTKMDKAKMKEVHPTINFVGRANANNGITTCVDKVDGVEPYPSGYMTLSLGGEYLGSCFIQPKSFYTSQNVIVLIPNDNMTDNVKRFIATMIFRESRSKYKAFVDELNRHIKTDFSIPLPITSTGEPDWQYMEDYMRRIMDKSEQIISDLQIGA